VLNTGTFVVPLNIVTPVTINWHETTLGSEASVPTVNTEAVFWPVPEDPVLVLEPPPQLHSTATARNVANTPIALDIRIADLLVSTSDNYREPKSVFSAAKASNTVLPKKLLPFDRTTRCPRQRLAMWFFGKLTGQRLFRALHRSRLKRVAPEPSAPANSRARVA
jgi:hypothetical protein